MPHGEDELTRICAKRASSEIAPFGVQVVVVEPGVVRTEMAGGG
jgi:hypothetical protein